MSVGILYAKDGKRSPSAEPHGMQSAVSSQGSMLTPGRTMTLPVTSGTVNSLSNKMEEPTAMSQLKIPRGGSGTEKGCILACWCSLPISLHLGKGGEPQSHYLAECPNLSDAHLTTGAPQDKGKRGNPSSAPTAPVDYQGQIIVLLATVPPWNIQPSPCTA